MQHKQIFSNEKLLSNYLIPCSYEFTKSTLYENIAVFSEKTDVPHPPNQSKAAISVMKP